MIKTIRVAGIAAAAAFLCIGNSAAAQVTQADPAVHAAAATPVTPLATDAPAASAPQPLTPVTAAPIAQPTVPATVASSPARTDFVVANEPAPAPAPGITAAAAAPDRALPLSQLVAEHGSVDTSDEQFGCLASAVYFESRGEPLEGQLAVAEVILNRVKSGRFRSTICDVVKQPSQFSFVRRGVIPQPKRDTAAWQRAVAIAHIAMNDLHDVTGEKSLFFHATYVNPGWGRPKIVRIGNHIFYR